MFDNMMAQFRQEERAYLHQQLQQMRESFSEELQRVGLSITEHVDKRLDEHEQTFCDEDDVDNHISQHVASFDELFDDKIGGPCDWHQAGAGGVCSGQVVSRRGRSHGMCSVL